MSERPRSREIEQLVEEFTQRLSEAIASATAERARVLSEDFLRAAAAAQRTPEPTVRAVPNLPSPNQGLEPDVVESPPEVQLALPVAARVRPQRRRRVLVSEAKVPPPVDPEEERRAAELARLRAILRPTAPVTAAPPVMAPPTPRAAEENDSLKALEDSIRDQIPSLASLSESRYTAQIAAWVGRVRLIQDGPDAERTRIASRMLFEKLRSLAWSMEAGAIEALNTSWSTRHWERYIQDNEMIAATPDKPSPPEPDPDDGADIWSTPDEAGTQS
jgi:hypothetical protein